MIEEILIVEPDHEFAKRLEKGLKKLGPYSVAIAADELEASLLLTRQKRDLAFIPITETDHDSVQALRSIQPDLPLVLLLPTVDFVVPDAYAGKVQASLLKSHLDADLPTVMKKAASQPLIIESDDLLRTIKSPMLETTALLAALQTANLGKLIQTVIFAQKTDLLAHWGELNITQAATVALLAGNKWQAAPASVVLRFVHLAARAGDLLLYTRAVANDYLLTLVAMPEAPLHTLRQETEKLTETLIQILQGKSIAEASASLPTDQPNGNQNSYAIVWRPIRPIPKSLHIPLRRAMERLAAANACILSYANVYEKLVHLVVACPPGQDSARAVYLFKNGSEDIIQREYGIAASLWDTGHYAIESTQPLSEAELNIFLTKRAN